MPDLSYGLVVPALRRQEHGVIVVSQWVVGRQLNGSAETLFRLPPCPVLRTLDHSQRRQGLRELGVDIQCFQGGRFPFGRKLPRRTWNEKAEHHVTISQACVRLRIARVSFDRLMEVLDAPPQSIRSPLVQVIPSLEIEVVRVRVFRITLAQARSFRAGQLETQSF